MSFGTDDDSLRASSEPRGRTEPQLIVALECDRPWAGAARFSLDGVDQVLVGRGETRETTRETDHGYTTLRLRVPARSMSSTHARLLRAHGQWILEDAGSRNGCFFNGQRLTRAVVGDHDLLDLGHVLLLVRSAMDMRDAPSDVDADSLRGEPHGFRTLVPRVAQDLAAMKLLAPTKVPILLLGETGAGKEALARGLHALSGRKGSLVAVNCGALPGTLVEAQFFGHVKGAFSGAARDEPGLVRSAHDGTLFLDEVGELPKTSQTTLLRVLQDGEVLPLGSARATKVDIRIISATHHPLEDAPEFRADLFGRLAGFTFHLAPLRERIEDLGLALADILASHAPDGGRGVTLTPDLGRCLLTHLWPRNFRELQQAVCAALALASDGILRPQHFPTLAVGRAEKKSEQPAPPEPSLPDEDRRLRMVVIEQLRANGGNVSAVARAMGKAPMQVHRWMKRFGIEPKDFRGKTEP